VGRLFGTVDVTNEQFWFWMQQILFPIYIYLTLPWVL